MKTRRVETGQGNWTSSCRVSVTLSDSATCGGFLISATGMVEVGTGLISYNTFFFDADVRVYISASELQIPFAFEFECERPNGNSTIV